MGIDRSVRRKKELEKKNKLKKESRDKLSSVSSALDSMPKKCDECEALFDKTDFKSCYDWRIAVYDSGEVSLVCPACSGIPGD